MHRQAHKFSESSFFTGFMLCVIIANCGILIAGTWDETIVNAGLFWGAPGRRGFQLKDISFLALKESIHLDASRPSTQ